MDLTTHLTNVSQQRLLPALHIAYLQRLKDSGFEPKVIYDIGACVLHWTNEAKRIWPDAEYILFDAFEPAQFLYDQNGYRYHIGVLSDTDSNIVRFYQNDYLPGGNSYYREIGCENGRFFPKEKYLEKTTRTLDSVIKERGFPLPDLVKMDVQGAELDIVRGGSVALSHAQHMILEMQHTDYNEGAPKAHEAVPKVEELGWKCIAPLFQNNGCDGDYGFVRLADSQAS